MIKFQPMVVIFALLSISLVSISFADVACVEACEPPTIGVLYSGQRIIENGFTINDRSFNVEEYYQTIPTTVVKTGSQVKIKLLVHENSGSEYIRHVGFSINDYKDERNKNELASISFAQPLLREQKITVNNPNNIIKDAKVEVTPINRFTIALEYSFKPVKPIDTSSIVVDLWDAKRTSKTNVFFNAIKVTGKEIIEKTPDPVKNVLPPLKQIEAKIIPQKIECKDGLEKITRNNGAIACVSTYTADMLRNMGLAS
ncbi:MAG: hypothetical protein ACT4OD_04890 [Candidatus Nitrosotenuis sp.]